MAQVSSKTIKTAINGGAKYPKMFSPLKLKNGVVLKNRVIMGSMHTGLEEAHGGRLTQMADFYAARAKGGCGLIVTGGIAPNREGWVAPFAAKLTNDKEAQMHKEVTEAVHAHDGAKIAMQILHSGRYGYHPLNVSASAIKAPIGMFTPRALSHDGVMSTIDDFARCTKLAAEVSFFNVCPFLMLLRAHTPYASCSLFSLSIYLSLQNIHNATS
jgi:2,4-dienoyl-CoA reductase (NADPH2)